MSERRTRHVIDAQKDCADHVYDWNNTLPSGRFARYLVLHPAETNGCALACSLHTAHLDDFPPFEAISYVWGTSAKSHSITCNGRIIHITANLSDALVQVRSAIKPRTLWVDSICINQADHSEQGHQVSLMDQIYTKSTCTLICLGRSDHGHAPIVAGIVGEVDRMIQGVFEGAIFDWTPNSFPVPDEGNPLLSHSGWLSFGVLLNQSWFRRGWVVQEAALSQSALILWAETEIDWTKLVRVYIWCHRRALILSNAGLHLSDIHLQGFYVQHRREAIPFCPEGGAEPFTFLEVLDRGRELGMTDPRDRIYAFQSIAMPSRPLPALRPDYNTSYMRVYHDFCCEYLRLSADLDILHYVHNNEKALECDFPSWIPRWDLHLYSDRIGGLNLARSSQPYVSQLSSPKFVLSPDRRVLELRGVLIDNIKFAAPKFDKAYTTTEDVTSLWNTISRKSIQFPYSCPALRAFVELFRCGLYRGRLKEWVQLESAYMLLLQRELREDDIQYGHAQSFHTMRMADVHNKKFILSDRGYYGLAPHIVEEGDICCVIFGTRSPFILRRTDRLGHYKLVGSVLILSQEPDRNGYPSVLGRDKFDWMDWGMEEETIFLC